MGVSNLSETSLEQLGASAHGHCKAGEKAKERADQQFMSAGIYLSEAKERISLRKDMNFAEFLLKHCPIGKSRAYEIIAISDGRKTVEEVREDRRGRDDRYRENVRRSADNQPEKPNDFNERPKPNPQPSFVDEAQEAHDALLKECIMGCRHSDTETLIKVKELINDK